VTGELEARWNRALSRVGACETRVAEHDAVAPRPALPPIALETLAADLQGSGQRPRRMRGSRSGSCAPSSTRRSPTSTRYGPRSCSPCIGSAAPTPSIACRVGDAVSAPARPPT
jgi:hypothetical protein